MTAKKHADAPRGTCLSLLRH